MAAVAVGASDSRYQGSSEVTPCSRVPRQCSGGLLAPLLLDWGISFTCVELGFEAGGVEAAWGTQRRGRPGAGCASVQRFADLRERSKDP